LTSIISDYLQKADFKSLRRACILQSKAPNGAQFPPEELDKVSATENLNDMLDILANSLYWNWIDLRMLHTLVAASNCNKAEAVLSNYKQIIFSKKLIEVLPIFLNQQVNQGYYSKVVSKLDRSLQEDTTVADLLKLQTELEVVVMDISKGTCVTVLDYCKDGCIEIHWYIPINCADHAFQTASLKFYEFHKLQVQSLKIGNHPLIYDPLAVKLPQTVQEFQLPDNAGM